ncbi:MAG: exodeoxyribonuclease VII small subunit [Bacteroidaceae bacterium]|nr:exodeoxyribonuclease VII small subunit [Bacteroidaceae bacterium]
MEQENNLTYEQAMSRLEEITEQISSGEMNVDDLAANLKQAQALLKFCEAKLKTVEDEIQGIVGSEE